MPQIHATEKIEYRSEEAAKRNVDDLMESWGMGF
jgi:hypothetical protein